MKILFQEIINKAIEMKASDVHFIPVKNEVSIKFRINDNLEQYEQIGNSIYQKLLVYMKFQLGLMFLHSKSHRAVDIVTFSIKYIF